MEKEKSFAKEIIHKYNNALFPACHYNGTLGYVGTMSEYIKVNREDEILRHIMKMGNGLVDPARIIGRIYNLPTTYPCEVKITLMDYGTAYIHKKVGPLEVYMRDQVVFLNMTKLTEEKYIDMVDKLFETRWEQGLVIIYSADFPYWMYVKEKLEEEFPNNSFVLRQNLTQDMCFAIEQS